MEHERSSEEETRDRVVAASVEDSSSHMDDERSSEEETRYVVAARVVDLSSGSHEDDERSSEEETLDVVPSGVVDSSSHKDDKRNSEEETWDVVAAAVVDSSSDEDEGPNPNDRPRLWEYQMREVRFVIQQFRRAYAEEVPAYLVRLRLYPYEVRRSHVITDNARERLHNCAREIRKLWNRTRRVCVRRKICALGNVNWNVHRRLRTAAVYNLIE